MSITLSQQESALKGPASGPLSAQKPGDGTGKGNKVKSQDQEQGDAAAEDQEGMECSVSPQSKSQVG